MVPSGKKFLATVFLFVSGFHVLTDFLTRSASLGLPRSPFRRSLPLYWPDLSKATLVSFSFQTPERVLREAPYGAIVQALNRKSKEMKTTFIFFSKW